MSYLTLKEKSDGERSTFALFFALSSIERSCFESVSKGRFPQKSFNQMCIKADEKHRQFETRFFATSGKSSLNAREIIAIEVLGKRKKTRICKHAIIEYFIILHVLRFSINAQTITLLCFYRNCKLYRKNHICMFLFCFVEVHNRILIIDVAILTLVKNAHVFIRQFQNWRKSKNEKN